MSTKTFPSTGGKPKFDPNASFESVEHDPVPKGNKPAFNPNKKFEAIANEEHPAEQPKAALQFKPMSDWLNIPQQGYQPMDQANAIPVDDHTINTGRAADRVSKELETIDPHIGNLIYDKKKDLTGRLKSQELGINPRESGPLNPQAAQLESRLREDVAVAPEEIMEFKSMMKDNPVMLRQGLTQKVKDLTKSEPVRANALKGDVYRLDRQANPEKEETIAKNIEKINNGEYDYDILNERLIKPLGFFPSIVNAFKEKGKTYDDYDVYQSGDEKKILDRIKQRLNDDPDKATPTPVGADGEVGAMLGGQPLKPIAGAIVAGALSGGTASAAAAAAISAPEMYKLTFGSALPHNYAALKKENPDLADSELLQRAIDLTHDQANTDALSGAAMGAIGAKAALKPATSMLLQKSVKNALKQIGETVAIEGIGGGAIGAGGQLVKNLMAQKAGIQMDESEGMAQQLVGGSFMTLGMAVAGKVGTILKPSTYTKLLHGLSKFPDEVISNELTRAQEVGALTPEEAQRVQTDIADQKKVDASIRGDVPEADRVKVQEKIKQRDAKEKELETAHKAYHPEIKEEIKKLDEDILALSKGSERGELQKLVDKSSPEGAAGEVLKNASEKELTAFLKDIAEQANDPATEQLTIETFGKEIVDKAKELYPQQETAIAPEVEVKDLGSEMFETAKKWKTEEPVENIPVKEGVDPMEGGIPPDMGDLPFTPEAGDVGRLAHADTEQIYKDLGMTDRIPRASKQDITLETEADNLIKSGYDFEGKADRVLSGRDKSFTDVEQVAFAKMVGALNVKLQKLEVNTPEFNETFDIIERLSRASDKVGSEEGAAFRARRMFVLNDETLSAFLQKAKEANLDVPLTPEQAASVKARFDDMKASRDAYRARLEKLAAENAKMKAEGVVKKTKSESKPSGKKTHEDYAKERSAILEQMREKLKKSRGEASIAIVPYAKELFAIAPEVGKLVKNLVEEGIDRLEDIVKAVHTQLKDVVPDITEDDVHNILAGEYAKAQTKTDIQEKIYEIKLQAKMINRLEALKAGVQPKGKVQRLRRNAEIEDLRKEIHDLKYPDKDPKTPVTKTEAEKEAAKLNALKARYKKQIDDLQKKIDTGDFKPDEKSTLAFDKEAQELKDAYIKKKIEWQKAVAQDAYNNRTQGQKAKDRVMEILGIPRTLMASADLSAPLRQGLVLTSSHPIVAAKAFIESLKQAVSPERFDRWLYDLKESDYYKNVIEKSGLYIADPNNLHLTAKEEAFMTNWAQKIPLFGDTLKLGKTGEKLGLGKDAKIPGLGVISKSERAYVAFLNKLRVDVFTMYATAFADEGMTPQNRPDLYEGLGAFINAATGRGELGDLEPAAGVLNAAFFSPRLMAARINMLNPVWYAALPKEVRVMALKDMGKMIALGSTTLLLASLAGAKVEANPTSTDFGKIHVGNTRWDIWGGFQQYVRAFSQLVSGYEKKGDGSIVPLGTERGQHTRAEKVLNLFRGKLAPVPSIATDMLTGKTAVGDDVELKPELREHLIPMIYGDVKEAWKEQGPMSILYTGVPSFIGVGTTTYEPNAPAASSGGKGGKPKKPTKSTKK